MVPAECVTHLDVPLMSAMKCLKNFGAGLIGLSGNLRTRPKP
jgi:hypothetical protein